MSATSMPGKFWDFLTSSKPMMIVLPGLFGGFISWILHFYPQHHEAFTNPLTALFLCLVFGVTASFILIILLINPDAADTERIVIISFLSGLIWPLIVTKGLESVADSAGIENFTMDLIGGDSPPELLVLLDPGAAADGQQQEVKKKKQATVSGRRLEYAEIIASLVTRSRARQLVVALRLAAGKEPERIAMLKELEPLNRERFLDLLMLYNLGLISLDITDVSKTTLNDVGYLIADQIIKDEQALMDQEQPDEAIIRTITALEFGTDVPDRFLRFADKWFTFEIAAGREGFYSMSTAPSIDINTNPPGTLISLFDAGMSKQGDDYDSGDGDNPLLLEYLPAGKYYLKVTSVDRTIGAFTLKVARTNFEDIEGETPPDNEGIMLLTQGVELEDRFTDDINALWYGLTLDQTGEYLFETTGEDSNLDTLVTLYIKRGQAMYNIGRDDDSGIGLYSRMSEYLPDAIGGEKVTYYVEVRKLTLFGFESEDQDEEIRDTFKIAVTPQ